MKHPLDCSQRIAPLRSAPAFCCFARVWWDGAGLDAVLWREDESGKVHYQVFVTGETTTVREPRQLVDELVPEAQLKAMLERFRIIGSDEISSQLERSAFLHYDAWFGIKNRDDADSRWLAIAGGMPRDARVMSLRDEILDNCPEIAIQQEE